MNFNYLPCRGGCEKSKKGVEEWCKRSLFSDFQCDFLIFRSSQSIADLLAIVSDRTARVFNSLGLLEL